MLVSLLLFVVFSKMAKTYKSSSVPSGIGRILEPIVLYVRDDIAIPNIGKKHYKRYMSFLLTVFFFIWTINLLGLAFNSMVNIHNPRQCHTTYNWSRYLSLYQLGLGARGIGFRDSSQDVLGILSAMPEKGKELIKKLISVKKEDGSAMHQFFPSTMEANEGDSREEAHLKDFYGDDHLWIVQSVIEYLKETGDYDFLEEEITYYDKKVALKDRKKGTVLEHLKRSLEFTKNNCGQHGLPMLGFAWFQ